MLAAKNHRVGGNPARKTPSMTIVTIRPPTLPPTEILLMLSSVLASSSVRDRSVPKWDRPPGLSIRAQLGRLLP